MKDTGNPKPCIHFVWFRGEEYHSAVKVWGLPDFIHIGWDPRAAREIWEGDVVIFAKGEHDQSPAEYNYGDRKGEY